MAMLPEGWSAHDLGDLAQKIEGGGTPPRNEPSYWDGDIPWASVKDLRGVKLSTTEEFISELGLENSSSKLIPSNTMIIASRMAVGKAVFFNQDVAINQDLKAFYPKENTDGLFLLQWYLSQSEKIESLATGSTVKGIRLDDLTLLPIDLPPLPEQQKIATILSSVDDVIEKTRAQIDKLKDLKTGMMQELLTKGIGHTEFKDSPVGRIPLSWSIAELRDVCTSKYAVVDGPFGSNLKTEHYRPTGIPVFQSGFVTSGRFVKREYVYVDAEKYNEQIRSSAGQGDILMAKIGMNAGACAIIPEDHSVGILAGNSLKMTVDIDKISNTYLLSILHLMRYTGEMRRLLTETAQPAVSITTLKSLKLALPPLPEQHEITAALNSIDSKYTSIAEKLAHLKQIKKALMQDLLTGKVRVNLIDKESAVV